MLTRPRWGAIPLEELASLPTVYFPTVAPDRSKIAFYWDKSGALELYVMDTAPDSKPKQVSHGELPKSLHTGYLWSKDARTIYFAKDNNGDEKHNIWSMRVETGSAEQLTSTPHAEEYPVEVSPDNRTLIIASNKDGQLNYYAFDLPTRQYTQLTDYANPVGFGGDGVMSPDGKQIAYVVNETEDLTNQDVYVMNADGSDKRRILQMRVGSRDAVSDWSKDGRTLAIGSDYDGYDRVGVYGMATGEIRWLSPEGKDYLPVKFSPDSTRLLAMRNEDSAIATVVFDLASGTQIPVELPPGLSYNPDWLDNSRFMVNLMTDVSRSELRDYRLSDRGSHVLLAAEYGSINPSVFVPHEYIWYDSTDGTRIPAILYRPRHLEAGKRYPAIVEIHGGPTGQFFRGFNPYAQFVVDRGFILIEPNVRGSTGYGVEFRDACLKDWGGKDLEDVQGVVNYLRRLPEVDPERIGVFGGSYGGYMAFMAITKKPHLWKAGVAWVGISDLHALYEYSEAQMKHFAYFLREQMGDPAENTQLWRDRSAINFADQMTAPLLMVHGVNDPRCPVGQSRMFRDRLLELGRVEGKDFEYVELGEEGHGSTAIDQKIRTYKILADFLERRL
jgi:dipeptidyl aminopeptidase/acylaminoacyl peptidase